MEVLLSELAETKPLDLSNYILEKLGKPVCNKFLRVTFYFNIKAITTQEATNEKVITLLKPNPKYSKNYLMKILKKVDATIKEYLANLNEEGVLIRVISSKAEFCEVVK